MGLKPDVKLHSTWIFDKYLNTSRALILQILRWVIMRI